MVNQERIDLLFQDITREVLRRVVPRKKTRIPLVEAVKRYLSHSQYSVNNTTIVHPDVYDTLEFHGYIKDGHLVKDKQFNA